LSTGSEWRVDIITIKPYYSGEAGYDKYFVFGYWPAYEKRQYGTYWNMPEVIKPEVKQDYGKN
jgi:hypothetical protein